MIGEQLGKWTVVKKLSRGGMADVYLAEESNPAGGKLGKAAVKILRLPEDDDGRLLDRFRREIDILRNLQHENIVSLYESGVHEGQPYLVMEYVDGLPLDQVLEQRGRLNWEEVVAIGQMVASALRYAHRQEVIHRDLKPANLLATWDHVVKLTDFGIARLVHDDKMTKDNAVVGTASYLSPEQATGKPATRKSDLYSLGIVLYELLTGRPPFEASSDAELLHKHRYAQFEAPSRLAEDIPPELDQLICSLLEKDPDKRPPNALAVEDVLLKLKRKFERKKHYTPSPSARLTRVMRREDGSDTSHEALQNHLPKPRVTFPVVQAVLLLAALGALFAMYLWLRQPASAEALTEQIHRYLQDGEWSEAQKRFDDLDRHHGTAVGAEQMNALKARINAVRHYQQARTQSGPYTFVAPRSEAERFYRRGVLAFYDGRVEEAHIIWTALTQAFKGVPAEDAWVRLAEDALKEKEPVDAARLPEVIQRIVAGEGDKARAGLRALRQLYAGLPDGPLKQQALEQIDKAVANLK
jgi:tRNA A-37 threonylcarbamoyl transferase component Bud32